MRHVNNTKTHFVSEDSITTENKLKHKLEDRWTYGGTDGLMFACLSVPPSVHLSSSLFSVVIHVQTHTCEPSDGRTNSPVFLGHLPISNILPNSPDFYMFLPYSPDFYMVRSQMCNLHHVHLGQGRKMQLESHITSWYFESFTQCRSLLFSLQILF